MQIKVPPSSNGDLQEARERRLVAFVAASIEGSAGVPKTATISVVARCGESPVARALIALRPVLAASGIKVRVVFSDEDATIDPFIAGDTESTGAVPEVRIIRNPRLRDAHEQLIVDGAAVWFGDSLRRDINRRDLFEQFIGEAPEAAVAAARAFEQLWARTEPCHTLAALSADSLTTIAGRKPGNPGSPGTALC